MRVTKLWQNLHFLHPRAMLFFVHLTLFNFTRNVQINQQTYKATWVLFTQAEPNFTPPCGEAGALATYLLYHRPPLQLLSLWCNWEWGYGSVPAQQCPTAVAESMNVHAAQQAWGPIQHPAMEESGVRWTKTQPNLKRWNQNKWQTNDISVMRYKHAQGITEMITVMNLWQTVKSPGGLALFGR